MSKQLVQDYFNEIDRLRKFSGTSTEGVISEAFKDLLKAWSRQKNLVFIAQYEFASPQKNRIRPDGTILHDLRVPLGYWEAKDEDDDLDEEISKKLRKGYPQDNIIFEDSREAVLIQNRQPVMRCSMTDSAELLRLLNLFFGYERQEIAEFRRAVQQFKSDLPAVLDALRSKIDGAYTGNSEFKKAADTFLLHAKDTINPTLGEADVREMLIQHILTEEIFANVFNDTDFHRENNIARELYALEGAFFTGAVKRDTLASIQTYYATIRSTAALITRHSEKQTFLKVIYENFYKIYDKKKADTLGVVYTPNEIVKFMIEGADWLTQKHFGKSLIDEGVEILDPATGTGTFICELLEHFRGQPEKLARKYKLELHANEVAILPYYVANLNIEATYAAITGQYAEFANLCFVDTLDNIGGLGIKRGHQHDLFAGLSDENIERVKRQNRRKISVVVGNPPYNANQQNENDNNKNRSYPHIDAAIKSTYIAQSSAHKTKLYDMYARFFRWASDRLGETGVVAFVTNRSFLDKRGFDGFRKVVAADFSAIAVIDLGGDWKGGGNGGGGNVFGIGTGVAITFLVKDQSTSLKEIKYHSLSPLMSGPEKLTYLSTKRMSELNMEVIKPDASGTWINQIQDDVDKGLLVALPKLSGKADSTDRNALFHVFSHGCVSNRDDWVYSVSEEDLAAKVSFYVETLNSSVASLARPLPEDWLEHLDYRIKWTQDARALAERGVRLGAQRDKFGSSMYRPFTALSYCYSEDLNWSLYRMRRFFPHVESENRVIVFSDPTSQKPFMTLACDMPYDLHLVGSASGAIGLARHTFDADGTRIDNITDWGLKRFHKAYGVHGLLDPARLTEGAEGGEEKARLSVIGESSSPPGVEVRKGRQQLGKDDIFHYVYGVLHDPIYRQEFALNLKREFPRIPFYRDFWQWAAWGKSLIGLHINYENVEPWQLKRSDTVDEKARAAGVAPKTLLKANKDSGIILLDSETQLSAVPEEVWTYKLGNRSGVEWVLDQYKEKTPKDPTIREKFNTYQFADYKEKVIDLIGRVTRVSMETVKITEAMKRVQR